MPAEQKREEHPSPLLEEEKCAAFAEKLGPQEKAAEKQSEEEQQQQQVSKQQSQRQHVEQQKRQQQEHALEAAAEQQKQQHKQTAAGHRDKGTAPKHEQQHKGEKVLQKQGTEIAAGEKQQPKDQAAESAKQQEKEASKQQTPAAEEEEEDGESDGEGKEGEVGEAGGAAGAGKKKKKKKKKKAAGKTAAAADGHAVAAAAGDGTTSASSVGAAARQQDGAGAAATGRAPGGGAAAAAAGKEAVLKGAAAEAAAAAAAKENSSVLRKVGEWKTFPAGQTWPPTESIQRLYKTGAFPAGEVKQLLNSKKGTAAAEQQESVRLQQVDIGAIREAAECHRQVRRYVQGIARPGIQLVDLCEKLEAKSRELLGCGSFGSSSSKSGSGSNTTLERGWGFPTGCSINNCAAHYTPNPGDKRKLEAEDICKLDFGVQVKGRIIDCAFSIAFDEKFDPLIQATQDGTNTGLKHAGVDARLSEIGGYIQEAIESYEMEIDGKMHPIKAIRNLTGHSIDLYKIHAGKSVPIVKAPSSCGAVSNALSNRMEEGEVYAIECFASTGRAIVLEEGECSHFMKNADVGFTPLRLKSAKDLLKVIDENFGTLAFCRRWLEELGCSHHLMALKQLVEKQILTPYPPLSDVKKSFTSQMEHTVFIGSNSVEVVSRGDDY